MEEFLIEVLRKVVWIGVVVFPIIGYAAPFVITTTIKDDNITQFVLPFIGGALGLLLAGIVFGPIALLLKIEQNTRREALIGTPTVVSPPRSLRSDDGAWD
jgi:ammonia channel protein AmtB